MITPRSAVKFDLFAEASRQHKRDAMGDPVQVIARHIDLQRTGHFGYKLSVSVDLKHGFIRAIATGTASEHDGHHFQEVLDMHSTGRAVHADKAYVSRQRQQMLKVLGFVDAMQRRARPGKPLSECQQRRNQRIAKKRAKVEHAFAGIRHMGGKFVRTIGQTRATMTMTPHKPYPTDVSDEEWSFAAPYLTLMDQHAPQREPDLREVFNALRWLVRLHRKRRRTTGSTCKS